MAARLSVAVTPRGAQLDQSDLNVTAPAEKRGLPLALAILTFAIAGLMALGAGVRAMNAGLACPDWPLCFGKMIPTFHVGVYFEFIHRAYAGLVAIAFLGCVAWTLRAKGVPTGAKKLAVAGTALLAAQIVMGGLTVLKLLKTVIVTSHLMLATLFFSCVLWMLFLMQPRVDGARAAAPAWLRIAAAAFPIAVLGQMALGGLVAASYAGSVCVDFPLCNGEWAPTFSGAIGLQVMHRFGAYAVAIFAFSLAGFVLANREKPWITPQITRTADLVAIAAFAQVCMGVANLILYIPPAMTVLHQSGAVITLALGYRLAFVTWTAAPAAARAPANARFA